MAPFSQDSEPPENPGRFKALQRKHAEVERELEDALAHPSVDDAKIHDLKRRKLHLKDEIARLKANGTKQNS